MTRDSSAIQQRLAAALAQTSTRWAGCQLQVLPDSGLAHTHVRLVGHGALARVPKQSQMGLASDVNLAYQAACFERAAASGHTPALLGVLPPSAALPRGALIVEEVLGQAAVLPQDLPAIVTALARLHQLPLPALDMRAPLLAAADPMADLLADIQAQAVWLDAAQIDPPARQAIDAEIARFHALCAQPQRPPLSLIAFDAHPGNFMLRTDGTAVLVDLEKCRYSHAPLDIAHATLYTSTTWNVAGSAVLRTEEVTAAYAVWSREMGAAALALNDWHLPLRRAMWLWSITWCAKWRVVSTAASAATAAGEDWSSQLSEPALIAHVKGRVDHYLSTPIILQLLEEFDALANAMPKSIQDDENTVMMRAQKS